MAPYRALAAAAVSRGSVELPDGKVYVVGSLSVGDMLLLETMQAEQASDLAAAASFAAIAVRVTGASAEVINLLAPETIGTLLAMARHGVDLVAAALAAEAPAEGNVPAGQRKSRRSTSRSAR
jgi:hypothetical protein